MNIDVNGITVLSNSVGPQIPVQNGRCGEDEWQREVGFNLRDIFGANIPSTVTVTGTLDEAALGGQTGVDNESASVTTRTDCEPGFVP